MNAFKGLPRWARREIESMVQQGYCTQQQAEEAVRTFIELSDREEAGTISHEQAMGEVLIMGIRHHRERGS